MNDTRHYIIILFIFAVVFLGFGIYKLNMAPTDSSTERITDQSVYSGAEIDPKTLLVPPVNNDVDSINAYTMSVEKASVATSTLRLGTNCEMNPLILRMTASSTLTVVNEDTVEHTIAFEGRDAFWVPKMGETTVNLAIDFKRGSGTYRYRCNDVDLDKNVGILYVVTEE